MKLLWFVRGLTKGWLFCQGNTDKYRVGLDSLCIKWHQEGANIVKPPIIVLLKRAIIMVCNNEVYR